MPLGGMEKSDARRLAEEYHLPVAAKPDSQEICFVENKDYAGFIERYTGKTFPKGNFVDQDGNILGVHQGIARYTIGQRKGLNIAYGQPIFVRRILENGDIQLALAGEDVYKRQALGRCVRGTGKNPLPAGCFCRRRRCV